jgi:hypothetical protein
MSDSLPPPEPGPALALQAGGSTRARRLRRYRWPLLVAMVAALSLAGGAWYLRDASDAGRAAAPPRAEADRPAAGRTAPPAAPVVPAVATG